MTVNRLAVRVTKDAERHIRAGHPWVFDESVLSVKPAGAAGDLAVVFDHHRKFRAIGLYDPASPIRIKVLHQGSPTPIDAGWFGATLDSALAVRADLGASKGTTGYRPVHGENDGLPGFVADLFDSTVVVKLYSEAWFAHLDTMVDLLVSRLSPERVVLRLARTLTDIGYAKGTGDGTTLYGDAPAGPIRFLEGGLTFEADVIHGQKTGWFLDQRDNRANVRSRSVGRRVLDVYSSSGGFSVNAAAGGALLVHSVDISPGAIAAAQRNMAHNLDRPAVAACRHEVTVGDAMEVMRRLGDQGKQFEMVIVDPPSFASSAAQVDGALRAYGHLTELAIPLVEPGGVLIQASCSSRVTAADFNRTLESAAARMGVRLSVVERSGHGVDHPIGFREGAYLKAVFATVHPR